MRHLFVLISLLLLTTGAVNICCNAQKLELTQNGITNYSIVASADLKATEAASILKSNLKKISGADFNLVQSNKGNSIYVLTALDAQRILSLSSSQLPEEEGVAIKISNKNVYIIGGQGNGVKNAVYEFLEKYLGCRYYTADAVSIPPNKNISVPSDVNYSYTPDIKHRYIYFGPAFKSDYAAWNKLQNVSGKIETPPTFGLFVHSMFKLVPPEKYFATHPEYYALRNGKRVKTQLNLTNPDVLQIAKQSLDSIIEKHPQSQIFSVSQMDNNSYCQCDNCKRKAAEIGSQSGIIIDFVNKIAAAFPDKIISTLAYNYSRSAPTNIKPAKNVNIMFCATGANHAVPFTDDKSKSSVYSDLSEWNQLTNNIFFWDYLVDFRHLYLPFPIYHTLQPNIQFLANNKITLAFMQGWGFNGSDMIELKTYLVAKLLWNPDINIKSEQSEFIQFYYGKAAPYIAKYLDALTAYVQSHKINLTTADAPLDHINDYLSPSQVQLYHKYFDGAKKSVANNPVYLDRVQNAAQSIRYTILDGISKMDTAAVPYENIAAEFKDVAAKAKVDKVEDGISTLNEFADDQVRYQKNKLTKNPAAGATAVITNPPSYKVNNLNNLFDKISANETIDSKWVAFQQPVIEMVIDLRKQVSIDSILATFMHNPQLKINVPEHIKYAASSDGKNFTDIGTAKNLWAGAGVKEDLKTFVLHAPANTKARYIKMNFNMVIMPNDVGDPDLRMLCNKILVL